MASTSRTSLHSSPSASFSSSASSTTSSSARERASKSDASLSSSSGSAASFASPRSVHFNERCVLIPEQRSPRVPSLFKTSTLEVNIPVVPWRWPVLGPLSPPSKEREFLNGGRDVAQVDATQVDSGEGPSSPRSPSHEVQHVVLKLPYPAFRRKSHSQTSPVGLRPCLRHSTSNPASSGSPTLTRSKSPDSFVAPRKPRRSTSLPPLPLDPNIKTIPLRPCCEKCLAACELHRDSRKRLPTLEESSREHTPSQSRLDLCEDLRSGSNTRGRSVVQSDGVIDHDEDWCAGLHFTKGAYKLWRSASADDAHVPRHYQEGPSGLLGSLVRVDEVDRKRGSSPNASVSALGSTIEGTSRKDTLTLNLRELDRVKDTDRLAPPSPNGIRSPVGSDNASEEDLFPLPSPKRLSPVATPSDSTTYLPGQISGSPGPILTEPQYLETAIRAKAAAKEREAESAKMRAQETVEASAAFSAAIVSSNLQRSLDTGSRTRADTNVIASGSSAPIPIPGAESRGGVSHFRPHLDEIKWDPSLPDPDALPSDSSILLNSPSRSPPLGPGSPSLQTTSGREEEEDGWANIFPLPHIPNISHTHLPHVSVSLPSFNLHLPEIPIPPLRKRSGSGVSSEPATGPASSAADNSASNSPECEREGSRESSNGDTSINLTSPPLSPSISPTVSRPKRLQSPESSPERTRGLAGRNRRPSLSNIMRAGAGVLKGLSLGGPSTAFAPAGVGGVVGGTGGAKTSVGNVEGAGTSAGVAGAGVSMSRGLIA